MCSYGAKETETSANCSAAGQLKAIPLRSFLRAIWVWGYPDFFGFRYKQIEGGANITVPHWFAAILTCALSAIPWIHWSKRFSLRTLLIATTPLRWGWG
jgi:hypothetical protein